MARSLQATPAWRWRCCGWPGYRDARSLAGAAERTLQAFAPRLRAAAPALPQMLVAQAFATGRPMEIVLAGPRNDPMLSGGSSSVSCRNAVVMRAEESPVAMPAMDGKPTAYVCENYACKLPVTGADQLSEDASTIEIWKNEQQL